MKVVPLAEVSSREWDALSDLSDSAWLHHDRAWIDLESRYFWAGQHSFALLDRGEIMALQPLYSGQLGFERLLHSGLHRHTGLALRPGLSDGEISALRKHAMRQIRQVALEQAADRIQLNVQNLTPASRSLAREEIPFWVTDHDFFLGLALGPGGIVPAPGMSTCQADQIVELTLPEEVLFGRLEESCRRAVRKGTASGLVFTRHSGAETISSYYRIAELSAQRTGESLAALAYYQDIEKALGPRDHMAVFIVTHDDKPVAGLFLIIKKGAASFLGGVSDPDYLALRVNDFMHWSALLWCKQQGLTHYRFGPFFPEVPTDWPVAKVSRFKAKFGARSVPIIQGSHFCHPAKYRASATTHLQQVLDAIDPPTPVQKTVEEAGSEFLPAAAAPDPNTTTLEPASTPLSLRQSVARWLRPSRFR